MTALNCHIGRSYMPVITLYSNENLGRQPISQGKLTRGWHLSLRNSRTQWSVGGNTVPIGQIAMPSHWGARDEGRRFKETYL